jgi:hypothetical protein
MASLNTCPFLPKIGQPGGPLECDAFWFSHFTNPADALAGAADAAVWIATADNGGTNVIADAAPGGVLRITPGTSANDFRSLQMNGEAWAPAVDRKIIYKTRIRTNDADDIKFVVGLTSTDTTGTTAGPLLDSMNDSICFRNAAGNSTTFQWVSEDDGTETTGTAGVLADDTWVDLAIEVEGLDRITFYVNGAQVGLTKVNIPDSGAPLTISFEVGSPTGTTATYLDVDYVLVVQTSNT